MKVSHEKFTIYEGAERVNETCLAFPDRFDLGAGQLDACDEFFQEEVLEESLLIFDADGFGESAHCFVKWIAKIGKKVIRW